MKANDNLKQKLRFLSPKTGISITLPMGWYREDGDDTENPTDIYFQSLGEAYSPCLTIKIIHVSDAEYHPNNYHELSEILLAEQVEYSYQRTLNVLEQRLEQVDQRPARIDIFSMIEAETRIPVTQYHVTIQLDKAVCGLVAVMKSEDKDSYLPIFQAAVDSIQFDS